MTSEGREVREDQGVRAYLADHAPFHAMTPAALDALAAAASVEKFAPGDLIVDYVAAAPDEIWMLKSGSVALHTNSEPAGDPVDIVEPGGVFGFLPLLSGGKVALSAWAQQRSEAIRIPGALIRSVFADPAGLSYLATSAWDTIVTRAPSDRASLVAVAALIPRAPLFVSGDLSVRDAVRRMADEHTSYALIRVDSTTLGVFTDRDLRSRVVAPDLSLDVPIGSVMSVPARTVPADRMASTVLMDMLETGLRHMPVVDSAGRVLGVVEDRDLVATSTRQSFVVRRAIALASDPSELAHAAGKVTDLTVNLYRGGTDASGTSAVLSVMIDAIVRRALDLELAGQTQPWTRQFAWLTLGSIARREAMPSSDVDSALSWADEPSIDPDALRRMASGVHSTLTLCGLPADSNGAVAYQRRFSRSAPQWSAAATGWLADPMRDRGLIMSSLMLDANTICGNPALNTVPSTFLRMPTEYPNALRLQLLDALSPRPRSRSLRDIVARRGGTLDLKAHVLTPIVNLARWAGLTAGLAVGTTPERLTAAKGHGILTDADAHTLREVFELIQRLRLSHQIDQMSAEIPPGDIVTVGELSPLSRSLINDGIREIGAVQRHIRNLTSNGAAPGIMPRINYN